MLLMAESNPDRELLEELVRWSGKSPSDLARTAGLTPSTLTRPLNKDVKHRLSIPTLQKLKATFPSFPGFGEPRTIKSDVEVFTPWVPTRPGVLLDKDPDPIPLLGSAMAGEWNGPEGHVEMTELQLSEILGYLRRPHSLRGDQEAYAVTIIGDSMWPRYRPGRRVVVSPRAPLAIGDDVIVQLLGDADDVGDRRVVQVLIKELVRRSASHVELRQFNPDITFKVETSAIAGLHKVVGEVF